MAVNNSLQSRSGGKPKFSVAIQTPMYQKLVNDTLGDPDRARRFVAIREEFFQCIHTDKIGTRKPVPPGVRRRDGADRRPAG